MLKYCMLFLYYGIFRYLPQSGLPFIGNFCRQLRYIACKRIFRYCGRNVNIERMAYFGKGFDLQIGDNSGIGVKCVVPNDIVIGKNVMMGPQVYILSNNHRFNRTDIPMIEQGLDERKKTVIADDVWIGREALFTPGRNVAEGSIVAARTVLTKDFEPYSIIGGNPSRLIRKRM